MPKYCDSLVSKSNLSMLLLLVLMLLLLSGCSSKATSKD